LPLQEFYLLPLREQQYLLNLEKNNGTLFG